MKSSATAGFVILGIISILAILLGLGVYKFFKNKLQKKPTTWLGLILTGFLSFVIAMTISYNGIEFYKKRVTCYYEFIPDPDTGKQGVYLMLRQLERVSLSLCVRANDLKENQFRCPHSEKIVSVNEGHVSLGDMECESKSIY